MTRDEVFLACNDLRLQALKFASRLTGHSMAEDAVQNAILQAALNAGRLRDESKLKYWFFRIVHSECVVINRRERRRYDVESAVPQKPEPDPECTDLHDEVEDALTFFGGVTKTIARSVLLGGLNRHEAGALTGRPLSTVEQSVWRVRLEVRKRQVVADKARGRWVLNPLRQRSKSSRVRRCDRSH